MEYTHIFVDDHSFYSRCRNMIDAGRADPDYEQMALDLEFELLGSYWDDYPESRKILVLNGLAKISHGAIGYSGGDENQLASHLFQLNGSKQIGAALQGWEGLWQREVSSADMIGSLSRILTTNTERNRVLIIASDHRYFGCLSPVVDVARVGSRGKIHIWTRSSFADRYKIEPRYWPYLLALSGPRFLSIPSYINRDHAIEFLQAVPDFPELVEGTSHACDPLPEPISDAVEHCRRYLHRALIRQDLDVPRKLRVFAE